jgi:hypothetical protein
MAGREGISIGMWLGIAAGAAAILFLISVVVNNAPPPEPAEKPHLYTQPGPFISETVTIEAGGHKAFRIDPNRPLQIRGDFLVPDRKTNIGFFLLTEDNYKKWQEDKDSAEREVFTGYVWKGKIDFRLKPQPYYVVFDNAENSDSSVSFDVSIDLDRP